MCYNGTLYTLDLREIVAFGFMTIETNALDLERVIISNLKWYKTVSLPIYSEHTMKLSRQRSYRGVASDL